MYKILVADDEKNIREVIREYAEFEGHEVKEAVDGMQVVEMAKNEDFDIIILDPPAFAKRHQDRHRGLGGYKFLNAEAIKRIAKGGLLFTFSCSQAVDKATFQGIVTAAAIEAKRNVRIVDQLSQPADHPINIFHPEGAYLKGLMLYVE